MKHTKQAEAAVVRAAVMSDSLNPHAFADWDGMVEIGRCAVVDDLGSVERIDEGEALDGIRAPFWSVYLHQREGGVDCIADFTTEAGAAAFAAGLIASREWTVAPLEGAA